MAKLILKENILKDPVMKVLATALADNRSIVEIDISQCTITPKGFQELFEKLHQNESITSLLFGNPGNTNRNRIGD